MVNGKQRPKDRAKNETDSSIKKNQSFNSVDFAFTNTKFTVTLTQQI